MNHFSTVSVAPWTFEVLRDPLKKERLTAAPEGFVSSCGRCYPLLAGNIIDLRVLSERGSGIVSKEWWTGQAAFEGFEGKDHDYASERQEVEAVYHQIPIVGRCLDVGGLDGRLRAFLSADQEYLDIDPFWRMISLPRGESYIQAYPFVTEPLNYVCAVAEHLPLASESFDTVHIRSVLDHLFNPETALREAYRVLRRPGRLVVGLDVLGGRHGRRPLRRALKEAIRSALVRLGINSVADHHLWHPTYTELCELIVECGFVVADTHWQSGTDEQVCYVLATK
jgi:SAM-dependent methyltransferase